MSTKTTTHMRARMRRRIGARGAAMVEGIIVLSVMVMFTGLIVWSRKAWGMKLDLQQRTRSSTLYFASHGCSGGGAASDGATSAFGGMPDLGGGAVGTIASAAGAPDKPSQSWNMASNSATGYAAWATAFNPSPVGSINYAKLPLVATVKAYSVTLCNEPKYGNQLIAWIKFGYNWFRTGGGAANLFGGAGP